MLAHEGGWPSSPLPSDIHVDIIPQQSSTGGTSGAKEQSALAGILSPNSELIVLTMVSSRSIIKVFLTSQQTVIRSKATGDTEYFYFKIGH